MKRAWTAVVLLGVVVLGIGAMYVGRRNQMVAKNQAVSAQWAQVDVVLQRRADLIPNLVETVKGVRRAGADRLWRHRQSALNAAQRANSGRAHRR